MQIFNILLPLVCLCFGFYSGYKLEKDKELPKIPKEIIHPIETVKENKETKKEEEKLQILQKDLEELDNYGG